MAQLQRDAAVAHRAMDREAERPLGLEPARDRSVAGPRRSPSTSRKSLQTKCGSMKRSCRAVPQRTSGPLCGSRQNQAIRRGSAAAGPGSSARPAASRSRGTPAGPAGRSGRRASRACRCRSRCGGCCRRRRSAGCAAAGRPARAPAASPPPPGAGIIAEGDVELVERVVARLVDPRRLAGRADEQAGEQVGQRRMALPVEQQALQHVRPAQERRVVRLSRRRPPRGRRRRCRCGVRRS